MRQTVALNRSMKDDYHYNEAIKTLRTNIQFAGMDVKTILFGMILSLELVNTAMEAVVDLVTEERRPLAKLAKDTAAGAVLIAAIMAAGVGLLIFVPKVLELI